MRQRQKDRLARRFQAAFGALSPAAGAALLGARFGVRAGGGPVPWCWPALGRLWAVLDALPESAVARNPDLRRIVRVEGDGVGAYRGGATRSPFGPGTVELGLDRPRSRRFGATVRHEIGHAVAARLGLYDTLYHPVPHSPWLFEGGREPFLRLLFGEADPALLRLARRYLAQAPGRRSLSRALVALRAEDGRRGRPLTPPSALRVPALRHLCRSSQRGLPCYYQLPAHGDGNIYCWDTGYGRGFVLRARDAERTRVSDYARRSPNEWFAELYAAYFAEGAPPGHLLRRRGAALCRVAEWMDERVAR